jgi:hypothetical protein
MDANARRDDIVSSGLISKATAQKQKEDRINEDEAALTVLSNKRWDVVDYSE